MTYCELPPDFYEVREPVARKSHECCECRAKILPGEKYVRCAGVWDFEFDEFKQHMECANACRFVRDRIECIPFGGLKEWWRSDGRHTETKNERWRGFRVLYASVLKRERRA